MPEDLPAPDESIKKLEAKRSKQLGSSKDAAEEKED